jgi:hypothetical protein
MHPLVTRHTSSNISGEKKLSTDFLVKKKKYVNILTKQRVPFLKINFIVSRFVTWIENVTSPVCLLFVFLAYLTML